jgi:hypothetical protein
MCLVLVKAAEKPLGVGAGVRIVAFTLENHLPFATILEPPTTDLLFRYVKRGCWYWILEGYGIESYEP